MNAFTPHRCPACGGNLMAADDEPETLACLQCGRRADQPLPPAVNNPGPSTTAEPPPTYAEAWASSGGVMPEAPAPERLLQPGPGNAYGPEVKAEAQARVAKLMAAGASQKAAVRQVAKAMHGPGQSTIHKWLQQAAQGLPQNAPERDLRLVDDPRPGEMPLGSETALDLPTAALQALLAGRKIAKLQAEGNTLVLTLD